MISQKQTDVSIELCKRLLINKIWILSAGNTIPLPHSSGLPVQLEKKISIPNLH